MAKKKVSKKKINKAKTALKKLAQNKELATLNFRADDKDEKTIRAKAKRFANGNVSAWLRHCALTGKTKPSAKDLNYNVLKRK